MYIAKVMTNTTSQLIRQDETIKHHSNIHGSQTSLKNKFEYKQTDKLLAVALDI